MDVLTSWVYPPELGITNDGGNSIVIDSIYLGIFYAGKAEPPDLRFSYNAINVFALRSYLFPLLSLQPVNG